MFKHRARSVYIIIAAVLIGYWVYNVSQPGGSRPFHLGLDLSGGTHLVYEADVSKIPPTEIAGAMSALRDVVENRVNLFGVSEPLVQTQTGSSNRLIVELPGITEIDEAVKSIGATPRLEFRLATADDLASFQSENDLLATTSPEQENKFLALFKDIGLTGGSVNLATLQFDPTINEPMVSLNFNSDGRKIFADVTRDHVGDYIGIFLDNRLISWPVIREAIIDGRAQISGSFTVEEARTLVRDLNYGALPIPITLISTQTIGPSLGQESVNGGIMAGIASFIVIGFFMIMWYRLPGLIATLSLAVYTILTLAVFLIIPVTLTAAGIAGFILSVGMAVDANILIFERLREELASGRGIMDAMHEGFARAWLSIRDSNISSIITALILYYFGSTSVIKGFALVFFIGVCISMFSAITVSRLFLYSVAPVRSSKTALFLINNGFKKFKN